MSFQKPPKLQKAEQRDSYGQHWKVPLTGTCSHRPGFFCYALICSCCASYTNRRDALRGDMSRYICCNGDWPCSGKMKENDCPEFCLGVEVCCCFAQSVASTRWMLQDQLHIRNTKCDNCIIGTMVALRFLSCICNIVACLTQNAEIDQLAELTDLVSDIVWCTVCGCMQTQVKIEMSENQNWLSGAPAQPYAAPVQQEMAYQAGGFPGVTGPTQPPQQMGMQTGYPAPQGYPQGGPGYPAPQGGAPGYPPPPGYPQY